MRWSLFACLLLVGCELPTVVSSSPDDDDDDVTEVPEPCEEVAWYADADGDGHGDPDSTLWACEAPVRTAAQADDCDDGDPFIRPGVEEICDGRDQDCDGAIDEDAVDTTEFFADADGDGFGSRSLGASCEPPPGASDLDGDCDDSDPDIHPDVREPICSLVDLDCDGRAGSAATQGGKAFATIQEAIDAAPERGQVLVCPGRWVESLTVSQGIRLMSTTGDFADVQIVAPDGQRVLQGSGSAISLRGLNLVGTGRAVAQEGGIARLHSNVLEIEDCRFDNGRASADGGILWWRGRTSSRGTGASISMTDTVFASSRAANDGGALYLLPGESGGVSIERVVFQDNSAGRHGGAVFVEEVAGSAVTWKSTISSRNEAQRGGSLYTTSSGAGSATTVLSSRSNDEVGGAYVSGRRLVLDGVTIRRASGAAAASAPRLTANDVLIEDASEEALDADELTVEDSVLLRNGVGARAGDDLRFTNVDVGTGANANDSDVRFAGRSFDFSGVVDARCSGSGCVEL